MSFHFVYKTIFISRKFEEIRRKRKKKKKSRGCGGENVCVGGIRRRSASFHQFRHAEGINQQDVDEFPPIWRNFQVVLETLDSETCTFNFLSNLIFFHIILFMKVVCNVTIYHIYFFQIFWWISGEPWNFPATKKTEVQVLFLFLSKFMCLICILYMLEMKLFKT